MNQPDGRRPRGRPKARWQDRIRRNLTTLQLQEDDDHNRSKWRQAVTEAKYQLGYRWPWQ